MTYSIQIIFEIKIFCIKIAWFAHFTKTVTSEASKSLVFVFFLQKITPFLQKYVWCILTHNYTKHHTFIHFRLMGIHFYSKLSCNLLEWNFWKSQHLEWADSFNVTCNWQIGIYHYDKQPIDYSLISCWTKSLRDGLPRLWRSFLFLNNKIGNGNSYQYLIL